MAAIEAVLTLAYEYKGHGPTEASRRCHRLDMGTHPRFRAHQSQGITPRTHTLILQNHKHIQELPTRQIELPTRQCESLVIIRREKSNFTFAGDSPWARSRRIRRRQVDQIAATKTRKDRPNRWSLKEKPSLVIKRKAIFSLPGHTHVIANESPILMLGRCTGCSQTRKWKSHRKTRTSC